LSVFLGGWGDRSAELIAAAAARTGTAPERAGGAAVLGARSATAGGWRCWVSGRVDNAGELSRRFPVPAGPDPLASIARAHAELGHSACDLLRGAFVIAAVDLERDMGLVSRDHLGGRPLVYARVGDGAVFAEHERDLLALLPGAPAPDRLALTQWLDRQGLPAGRTLHEGLRRLPAAHHLVLSREGVGVERYWAPSFEGTASGSRQEVGERLRGEVFAAVDRAAGGARRAAVRLSGGLDSAAVAAGLAARGPYGEEPPVALSAVFPALPETDERELIEATAAVAALPSEQVGFEADAALLPAALRHIERWGLPPTTPNLFVWEPVMASARRLGVDLMLDGEGGDELFGMSPYLIADRLRRGRLLDAWSLAGEIPGLGADPDPRLRLRALRVFGIGGLVPSAARRWRRRRRTAQAPDSVLTAADAGLIAERDHDGRGRELDGPLWWRSLAHGLTAGREVLDVAGHLQREGIDGGLERRHPFLFDRDLVEAVLAIPPRLQFDSVRDRPLLRDALRGHIPEPVRERNAKSDFTPLLVAAMAGRDGDLLRAGLAQRDAPVRAYVSQGALDALLAGPGTGGTTRAAHRLWRLGTADLWLRGRERPEYLAEVLEKAS
jgi:asparagine synthase (glutamine-hydrolysing)